MRVKPERKVTDLIIEGDTRWTVKSYAGYNKRHLWNVECLCGTTAVVSEYQLKKGLSRSCGCLAKDTNRVKRTIHGESSEGKRSPELRAYNLAKNQCRNPTHENFAKFGARGIRFLFESFEEFLASVGRKPDRKFVLTRIDETGDYEAGNIKWTKNKNRKKIKV